MNLKIEPSTMEKKILGRIFVRLMPLLKTSFITKDSFIDLFEIIKILPVNFNLYTYEALPEGVNKIDTFLRAEKDGDINNLSIEINIYNRDGDDFEEQLTEILHSQKELSTILIGLMQELLCILHKFFHPIKRGIYLGQIKRLYPNKTSDEQLAMLSACIRIYTIISLYEGMCNSGIKNHLPKSELISNHFDHLTNVSLDEVIKNISQVNISFNDMWERTKHITIDTGLHQKEYLGRFFAIGNGEDTTVQEADSIVDSVSSVRSNLTVKMAGSSSARMMDLLGIEIEVEVDWLGDLTSLILEEASHYTAKQDISYRKIKNKYRHIANLPGPTFYENKLKVICVVDQSGSVSDYELRKINFVMKKLSEKAKEFDLIVHDYSIVAHEKFRGRTMENDIGSYIQKRMSYGGTCHTDVFQRIEEEYILPENSKHKFIVLTFSDMYSNIEALTSSGQYTWCDPSSGVSKYWVTTQKEITSVHGTHIHVDKGVIT